MTLRTRIVIALLLLTTVLVAPAVYGVGALRELGQIALQLQTRDAVGSLALGRLQAAVGEVESQQRVYLALAGVEEARDDAERRVRRGVARADSALDQLRSAGYDEETARSRQHWDRLIGALEESRRRVEQGEIEAADEHRTNVVVPAFAAMNEALEPIGVAIDRGGAERVERAQSVAEGAATTTLIALAVALVVALFVSGWLAGSLLRPIGELRRGMAVVAEGDFEHRPDIQEDRPDELGDLARSFTSMTERLAELERLRAEFVSVASHELKTPLSVIQGYISLLLEGVYGDVSTTQRETLGTVQTQTARLGTLVQQLLDVSRFEAGSAGLDLRPVAVEPFLRELTESFNVLAYQNAIDFDLELEQGVPDTVTADPDRLNEVIGNLLSNAFKFTQRGGRIRLRARGAEGRLEIEVEDSGVGIPADKLPQVFEKFFQVENRAQPKSTGSGLGLSIAREFMEAHGGSIHVHSEVDRGSRFYVSLPNRAPAVEGADA